MRGDIGEIVNLRHARKQRARVAHVFGDQKNCTGAEIVQTIGIVPAPARSA